MATLRRTQAARRAGTRTAFLDAALGSLLASGVSDFITPAVARRAGLSQGALFKHFPTKSALVAATTEHLFAQLRAHYEARFRALPPQARTLERSIDVLWDIMCDPRLAAAYDLFTAARTNLELQAALAPVVSGHEARLHELARELLPELSAANPEPFRAGVELAIRAMQGLVLNEMARPDAANRARLLGALRTLVRQLIPPGAH